MKNDLRFTVPNAGIESSTSVGHGNLRESNVAAGTCLFCLHKAAFTQVGGGTTSDIHGEMVGLKCNGCNSVFSASIDAGTVFPNPELKKIADVPEDIAEYYEEGIRCIDADAPNGAVSVFRKLIEAVCTEYEVTEIDDNLSIYEMVNKLGEKGHITEELRKSLLALKDAGNDAAHLNENDPTLEQAKNLKGLVEAVMTATVVAKSRAEKAREDHPNPHLED